MEFQDTFKVTGNVVLRRYDENGVLNLEREHKNLVVTAGKQLIASRLAADTRPAISILSISGDGSTATVIFTTQLVIPYEVGTYVTLSGNVPTGYNGTFRVETATTSQITFSSNITEETSTEGIINSLYNGTIKKMHIGESNTVANLSDTALINDIANVTIFSSGLNITGSNASISYIALFPAGVGTSIAGISESALINDSGKMLCRTVFPLVTKAVGESLEIFWTVTIN